MTTATDHRSTIQQAVATWSDRLVALSHDLHEHPELNFEEHHAARRCW